MELFLETKIWFFAGLTLKKYFLSDITDHSTIITNGFVPALLEKLKNFILGLSEKTNNEFISGLLEGMNNEFVVSYINLIDGEQDPRNLMLIFNMTVIVLQHFNLGNAHLNFLSC